MSWFYAQKWVKHFRLYGTLKSGDESRRLIEWFLYGDSDWIIFGLTTSLLPIFDICLVFTAVVLFKNDILLLVPTGKVLELGFLKSFLMKACGKIVERLWKDCFLSNTILRKYGKWPETKVLILHSYWTLQYPNFGIFSMWLSHSTT